MVKRHIISTVRQEGIETKLSLNEIDNNAALFVPDINLFYDLEKLLSGNENYLNSQIAYHSQYRGFVREQILPSLFNSIKNESDGNYDNKLIKKHVSPKAIKYFVMLTKVFIAPHFWLKGTTMKSELNKKKQLLEKKCEALEITRNVFCYGNDLVNTALENSNSLSSDTRELVDKLAYETRITINLYEGIVARAKMRTQSLDEFATFFYLN